MASSLNTSDRETKQVLIQRSQFAEESENKKNKAKPVFNREEVGLRQQVRTRIRKKAPERLIYLLGDISWSIKLISYVMILLYKPIKWENYFFSVLY